MQYAFVVNSDACSGCKTCQVACNDKHDIRAGLHWRTVYEVTAGSWQKKDGVWTSGIAAYYLSVACHHCQVPVCGESCQAEAIWKRADGLVLIDENRCTRCRKCEVDCPYGAIRWDAFAMIVRKCDGCVDYLDAGKLPVCVTACPNRALEFGDYDDSQRKYKGRADVFPLPDPAVTKPALIVRPHRNVVQVESGKPEAAES